MSNTERNQQQTPGQGINWRMWGTTAGPGGDVPEFVLDDASGATLGVMANPLYNSQGVLQAPGTQQLLPGDTVGLVRVPIVVYSGMSSVVQATQGAGTAVGTTGWISTNGVASAGLVSELQISLLVTALGTGNSAFNWYVEGQDSYGNVNHLYAITGITAGQNYLVSLGAGCSQASASVAGLNAAATGTSSGTTVGVALGFGATLRISWSYTSGGTSGPTLSVSIMGK